VETIEMKSKHTTMLLSLATLLAVLSSGCLFDPPIRPPVVNPVVYHEYTPPDSLVLNFILAWEDTDAIQYRDKILYNEQIAPDDQTYRPFIFYYAEGDDIWGDPLPSEQTYDEEVGNITRMFSGNNGKNDVPGVRSITLTLTKNNNWQPPPDPLYVEGDTYPEGTLECIYQSDMLVTLKGTVPNSDITGYEVQDELKFYAIPVKVSGGGTEYRIWKWRDLVTG